MFGRAHGQLAAGAGCQIVGLFEAPAAERSFAMGQSGGADLAKAAVGDRALAPIAGRIAGPEGDRAKQVAGLSVFDGAVAGQQGGRQITG